MTDLDRETEARAACDDDRRRLLRASAAAPLIATLAPNSAMAMASAACDVKLFERDLQMPFVEEGTDEQQGGVLRVQAVKFTRRPNVSTGPSTVYAVPDRSGRFFDGDTGDEVFPAFSGLPIGAPPDAETIRAQDYDREGVVWLLRQFDVDAAGGVVYDKGFFPQPKSGQALSHSCLTSIDPDGPQQHYGV